jgi:hypothetical protein
MRLAAYDSGVVEHQSYALVLEVFVWAQALALRSPLEAQDVTRCFSTATPQDLKTLIRQKGYTAFPFSKY